MKARFVKIPLGFGWYFEFDPMRLMCVATAIVFLVQGEILGGAVLLAALLIDRALSWIADEIRKFRKGGRA